ncbi:MAG: site-specific integrase [Candidatus Acidiferrales bacterium]
MTHLRRMMLEELQRRNYAKSTVKAYLRIIQEFANYFHQRPDKLGPQHLREYQAYLFQEKKLEAGTAQQHVAALRFFYIKTLKRRYLLEDIPRPKRYRKLAEVLSPEEVVQLIDSASNLFHRTMLMTPLREGLDGVIDSLLAAQHVLEKFRRTLPNGTSRYRWDRLSNRLTKILNEARNLATPREWAEIGR